MSGTPLGADALDLLFRSARSYNSWDTTPVTETDLRQLYDLVKMGPTSANTSPARFIFCTSPEARARLSACATANNKPKILAAPVTAIIGFDMDFGEKLPELFPQMDVRSWFAGPEVARETAFRNSSLQGAYFIMAARALGWDTGPMSGFDTTAVNAAFWAGTSVETNFICTMGKGTSEMLWPRLPRLAFEDAATIL
ncbi:MAG: malonic semialdehyde reductase [Sandarakinorhabdus sp.]|nr:malonic semialdehyde reductase [Sandarakinorhabdus sp.]